MIKIPTHTDWTGEGRKPIDGAMERLLKANPAPVAQPAQAQIQPRAGNNEIYVPSVKIYFAKERTLQGNNWKNTHIELIKQGLQMPTPMETWELIFYLRDNVAKNPQFREVYDDILKTTPANTWHGEWQNAIYSKDKGKMYVQKVTGVDKKGELVLSSKEKLDDCLQKDCWALIGSRADVNNQGLCTLETAAGSYEQGKNIYFWYPREGAVARFSAYSDRAVLYCIRDPASSNSSLGVRAIRRA